MRVIKQKTCTVCNLEFTPRVNSNQIMCSDTCVRVYRSKWMNTNHHKKMSERPLISKNCDVCNTAFTVKSNKGRPKTCSLDCQDIMNRQRLKKWGMKHRYGLSQEKYDEMLASQKGCCAICEKHHTDTKHGLYVDHDHGTDELRSLLCRECNSALGFMQDSPEICIKAANYLKKHKDQNVTQLRSL